MAAGQLARFCPSPFAFCLVLGLPGAGCRPYPFKSLFTSAQFTTFQNAAR